MLLKRYVVLAERCTACQRCLAVWYTRNTNCQVPALRSLQKNLQSAGNHQPCQTPVLIRLKKGAKENFALFYVYTIIVVDVKLRGNR